MVLFLISISARNMDGLISCYNDTNKEAGFRRNGVSGSKITINVDSSETKEKEKIGKGKSMNCFLISNSPFTYLKC